MRRAVDTAMLAGLVLHVSDPGLAIGFACRVLGLPLRDGGADGHGRFALGSRWLSLQAGEDDSLHWQCADLAVQRAQLGQLGIDTCDDAGAPADGALLVGSVDTGACAAAWTQGSRPTAVDSVPRLSAIVLRARAPERVAAHWSQMLQAPVGRDARGLPCVWVDGVALSFAIADDSAGSVDEIALNVDRPADVLARAESAGADRDGEVVSLAGLTVRVV